MVRPIKYISVLIIILVVFFGGAWYWYKTGKFQKFVFDQVGSRMSNKTTDLSAFQEVLGFDSPKIYLVLFLNNTELRPGGGFIGAYATIKINKGVPDVLKVEGTEIIDNLAQKDILPEPPKPLEDYLKIKYWALRDSNWSPDFSISSAKAIQLYKLENGLAADDINGVIGFTPTVVEEIIKISGPIKVGNEEFDADNFTQKLEYEVEFGYSEHGLDFDARKKILSDLTHAMIRRVGIDALSNWSAYLSLLEKMTKEKQIIAYALDRNAQNILVSKGWAGEMKQISGDYLLWVDANLGALKTDAKMNRKLSYSISNVSGKYLARTVMKYSHQGKFDKFTTRYRTYSRIFVPIGSKFLRVSTTRANGSKENLIADTGAEEGKQWFGTYISIEPGTQRELIWEYELPDTIKNQINAGEYSLLVQKQIGTIDHSLTLGLNFGKKLLSASPAEPAVKQGDERYDFETNLREDRQFNIELKK